jgi:hypothetical protein
MHFDGGQIVERRRPILGRRCRLAEPHRSGKFPLRRRQIALYQM